MSDKVTQKIIGIDLGTTNSCVAVMEGDERGKQDYSLHRGLYREGRDVGGRSG